MWWSRRPASLPVFIFVSLALSTGLSACGGGTPLQQITPVPGSRTSEGGTIMPLDSSRGREIRPLQPGDRTIVPVDSGRSIRPLGAATGAAREIVPLDTTVVPVDDTKWVGSNHEGELTLEFRIGGILRYTAPSGTWTNGTWRQVGNTVTFEMNDHYAEYTGQVRGTRISGTGHNRTGARWEWRAERQ